MAISEYLKRHNEVGRIIHRSICEKYNIRVSKQAWKHEPQTVTETDDVKILWHFEIRTDRRIPVRRPGIVVIDKRKKSGLIIDVAVPDDKNINVKEREKIEKYHDLRIEIQKLWQLKATVVPVVVGALGARSEKFEEYLSRMPGQHHVPALLKAALLGSAYILRRTLDLPESW